MTTSPAQLTPRPSLSRSQVSNREFVAGIERGMIFWAEVLPNESRDSEQHHQVPSPWLVVSKDSIHRRMPIAQAVPLTTKIDKGGGDFRHFRIKIPTSQIIYYDVAPPDRSLRVAQDQLVLTEQLRVVAHARLLGNPVAKLAKQAMSAVETGLRYVLDLP